MLPTYYLESRIDTSGAEPGRAFDTSGAEPGRAFDTSGAEPGRAFDTSGAEPGRAFDTSGAEPGRAFDTSGAEPGRAFDTSGAEPGRAFDTSGAEPGRTFDTSGAEPGRAFDTFGSGPDRQYHGNMNNNNKRLPDIVNQENEFWSQPAQEAFYIPQPPSTLIPALPFTQTDEGLHDLPQDANWLFGDTGSEVDNLEMIEMDIADDDIDLYGDMSSPERTSDSSEEDDDIHPRIHNPTRNRSPMASETDEFVMEALGEIFWDTREAIIDNTEDGDDPDFDPLVETALNCIRNYDVIRASAQALLNDHRNDELVLDSGDSEAGHSRWYTGRSRGGSSSTAGPSRWTRLPDFSPSSCSSVSVTSPDPGDDPQLTITALTDDKGEVTADRNEHTYSLNTADNRDELYPTEGFDPHANYNNPDRNEHTYSLNIEDNRDDFYRTEGFDPHANYNNPDRNEHTYSLNIVDNRDKLYPTEGFDPHANYNNPDRNEHTYSLNIEDNRDEFYPKEGFNPHAYYDNPDHTYTRFARPQAASDTVTGDASGIDILETALQDETPTFNWKLANEWAKMTANVNVNSEPGPSCNINPPHGTVHSDHQHDANERHESKSSRYSAYDKWTQTEPPKLPEVFTDTNENIERWLEENKQDEEDSDTDSLFSWWDDWIDDVPHDIGYTVVRLSHSDVDMRSVSRKQKLCDSVYESLETKSDSDLLVPYKRKCL